MPFSYKNPILIVRIITEIFLHCKFNPVATFYNNIQTYIHMHTYLLCYQIYTYTHYIKPTHTGLNTITILLNRSKLPFMSPQPQYKFRTPEQMKLSRPDTGTTSIYITLKDLLHWDIYSLSKLNDEL